MTIYQFHALEENDKATSTWDGTFFGVRQDIFGKVLLYELGGFYVEVYYHEKDNKILRFRPFKSTKNLDLYLNQISI